MGYKFNPFTGSLDTVDSPNGVFEAVEINGDITLDDGGTYTTTLQTITPTANRTVSLPDATGTVALVAGSSGQLVYNNAGAQAGVPGSTVGATGDVTLALNGAASTPPLDITGTWFTGGTSTTTKPQVLIEPAGTTSTAWSTSGTGLGINAATGFTGRLLDLQTNGTSRAVVTGAGQLLVGTTTQKGLFTLGSGSHYSVVDPGATIKKVDYTSAMGSESFFSWRTWRSGKNYAAGVSGVATIAVPSPSLLRVKIMATADGVGVRNYAYEAYVLATPVGVYTIDVIKQTTLLTGGSSPAMSGSNLVFTCPAAASNQSLIYVEVEQVSSQSDTTITFS